jgi:hypothetical protein
MRKLWVMGLAIVLAVASGCASLAEQALHDQNVRNLKAGRISGAEYLKERRTIEENFNQR